MSEECVFIENLFFSGFRSFAKRDQFFEGFGKVNVFIGANNSGKSNVLSFINDILPQALGRGAVSDDALDVPVHKRVPFEFGFGVDISGDEEEVSEKLGKYYGINDKPLNSFQKKAITELIAKFLRKNADFYGSNFAWFVRNGQKQAVLEDFSKISEAVGKQDVINLWSNLSNKRGGQINYERDVLQGLYQILEPKRPKFQALLVPAVRKISVGQAESVGYDGGGIIQELVKLQNPSATERENRLKFDKINKFLKYVTSNPTAEIEIPHELNTILVHIDGKVLPLENLGTGIHEVIILASAATIHDNYVICLEEPELHLNPILQKKLIQYLFESTSNQYFITSHSASLMDFSNVVVYHLSQEDGDTIVNKVLSNDRRRDVCDSLGLHPSDLLQSNCVIWVEGPSDRIYLNYWIRRKAPFLKEGIDYSIMFYGGKSSAHLSGSVIEFAVGVDEFISLRRLNQNSMIVMDRDSDSPRKGVVGTKRRLKLEFSTNRGFAWITYGREIENYLPKGAIKDAIESCHPKSRIVNELGDFDNRLKIRGPRAKSDTQANKVEVAKYIVENYAPDFSRMDLDRRIDAVIDFIKTSNPSIE